MCSWKDILSFGFTSNSQECYEQYFEEVTDWLNYFGELIKWSFETLLNLIDLLLTVLLSLPITVLLAILHGNQLLCYQTYRSARMVLSLNGFVMPEADELNSSVARNLITLSSPCAVNFKTFPSIGTPVHNSLICPVQMAEQPSTAAAFHPTGFEINPDHFIKEAPFNENVLHMYALAANSPIQTLSVQHKRLGFGNARDLTAWMIQHANEPNFPADIQNVLYTSWNLDSDRGYGYHTWEGIVPNSTPCAVEDEEYLSD